MVTGWEIAAVVWGLALCGTGGVVALALETPREYPVKIGIGVVSSVIDIVAMSTVPPGPNSSFTIEAQAIWSLALFALFLLVPRRVLLVLVVLMNAALSITLLVASPIVLRGHLGPVLGAWWSIPAIVALVGGAAFTGYVLSAAFRQGPAARAIATTSLYGQFSMFVGGYLIVLLAFAPSDAVVPLFLILIPVLWIPMITTWIQMRLSPRALATA